MRRKPEGEKKAIQILTSERIFGVAQTQEKFIDDPTIMALYAYLYSQKGYLHPSGGWINNKGVRRIRGRRVPGVWLPYPREVQPCCKQLSEKHVFHYGGYWGHCLGIKHHAFKYKAPYPLLRQTVYYYLKHKGGKELALANLKMSGAMIIGLQKLRRIGYATKG